MKKVFAVSLALLAIGATSQAQAADLVLKAPPAAAWSWTGFYIGGNAGYSWGNSGTAYTFRDNVTGVALATLNQSIALNGGVAGVQAGYNWQNGRLVWGFEGDLQWTGQRGSTAFTCAAGTCGATGAVTATVDQKMSWLGTLRGRLGMTGSPVMAYFTGGLAIAQIKTSGVLSGFDLNGVATSTAYSASTTKTGWTVGGGVEGVITGNWTAKIEYLYVDLGTVSGGPFVTGIAPAIRTNLLSGAFSSRVTDNILRVGVNRKF